MLRAPLHVLWLHHRFVLEQLGRYPVRITMHPRVWVDVLATVEGYEAGWIDHRPDGVYFLGMLVVEDDAVPGIEMFLS